MKLNIVFYLILFLAVVSCTSRQVTSYHNENIAINSGAVLDSTLIRIVEPYKTQLDSSMKAVIGTSSMEMTAGSPEGLLGNYICDLSFELGNKYFDEIFSDTADFCILNNGGFRTFLPEGPITRRKVYEIMPFENELVVVTISPEKMKEMLDYIGRKTVNEGSRKQGVPVSGNLKIKLKEQIPISVTLNGAPIRGRNYKVLTTDYLAGGGDYMSFFLNPIKYQKLNYKLRDAILEKIEQETENGMAVNAMLDKRISYGN